MSIREDMFVLKILLVLLSRDEDDKKHDDESLIITAKVELMKKERQDKMTSK